MLLFSAVLEINDTMTKEDFVRLVIEWNQTSTYNENIIPGLVWDGQYSFRCGTERLWLGIEEYGKILAVRHRKISADGVIWDSDFVMNFDEERMSVRLERSYEEEAIQISPAFSTPHFITMLIEKGYLKDDGDLPVGRTPVYIDENHLQTAVRVINGTVQYRLPVIYVSKTYYDEDPLDVLLLSSRVKGAAHVLVQKNVWSGSDLQIRTGGKNEYHGAVGIYFPNKTRSHIRLLPGHFEDSGRVLLEKTVRAVVEYANSQVCDPLYTWQGVSHALLRDELEIRMKEAAEARKAREEAENEVDEIYSTFDRDLEKLTRRINELTAENEALSAENLGLRTRLNRTDVKPLLKAGEEEDLFPEEIREIVLSILKKEQNAQPANTRRSDVLLDILEANPSSGVIEKRTEILRNCLKDYKSLSAPLRQTLADLGFSLSEEGKHIRLTYCGDSRYKTTMSKSGSDYREGRNIIAKIIQTMM